MSDYVDQAQETIDLAGRVAIQTVRNRMQAQGSDICQRCGEDIPAERRRVVPWARTCATCQDILEHHERVGQRSAGRIKSR